MAVKERCQFYRNSEGLGLGRRIGDCNIDGGQTLCGGDVNLCEKPSDLKRYKGKQNQNEKDRREYPRFVLDLPLEYRARSTAKAHGGLVVNASEIGLLIRSIKNMSVGTELKIAVMFPRRYELAYFDLLAKVVRKEPLWKEDWEGYEYGLKFVEIFEEDLRKLRQLLSVGFGSEEGA